MKAVVCRPVGARRSREVARTRSPDPGQVLLEVVRCGICGSDLHARHARRRRSPTLAAGIGYPDIMRPRRGGGDGPRVQRPGAGVRPRHPRRLGDRAPRWSPCRCSRMARHGADDRSVRQGARRRTPSASSSRRRSRCPSPNGHAPSIAAMTEPMAVAWHAVRREPGSASGETAVVDRLRPDRAGRDPDAQGRGRTPRGGQRLLRRAAARWPQRAAPTWSSTRRPSRRGRASRTAATSPTPPTAARARARHDGASCASVPMLPWCAGAARRRGGRRRRPTRPGRLRVRRRPRRSSTRSSTAPRSHTRVVVVGVCMEPDTVPARRWRSTRRSTLRFVFAYDPARVPRDAPDDRSPARSTRPPCITGTVGLDGVAARVRRPRRPRASTPRC